MIDSTNYYQIIIKAPVHQVWKVLTGSTELPKYLPNMKVVSDWKTGSNIEYTCFDENGSIMMWNDRKMIWKGTITALETDKIFSVDYHGNAGLSTETYTLEEENDSTKLTFTQVALDSKTAENYNDGNLHTLNSMKKYIENTPN